MSADDPKQTYHTEVTSADIGGPRSPVRPSQQRRCSLRWLSYSRVARLQQRLRSFRRLAARPVAKIDSGAGTGVIGEETGITRNVKGEGPFHEMSVRCLYHWSVALLALFGHPPALRNVRYRG